MGEGQLTSGDGEAYFNETYGAFVYPQTWVSVCGDEELLSEMERLGFKVEYCDVQEVGKDVYVLVDGRGSDDVIKVLARGGFEQVFKVEEPDDDEYDWRDWFLIFVLWRLSEMGLEYERGVEEYLRPILEVAVKREAESSGSGVRFVKTLAREIRVLSRALEVLYKAFGDAWVYLNDLKLVRDVGCSDVKAEELAYVLVNWEYLKPLDILDSAEFLAENFYWGGRCLENVGKKASGEVFKTLAKAIESFKKTVDAFEALEGEMLRGHLLIEFADRPHEALKHVAGYVEMLAEEFDKIVEEAKVRAGQ